MAGCFDEVADGVGAVEAGVGCLCDEVVDSVAEFVEEGDYFFVLEETGLLCCRLREVAHQCGGWVATCSILFDEALCKLSANGDREQGRFAVNLRAED